MSGVCGRECYYLLNTQRVCETKPRISHAATHATPATHTSYTYVCFAEFTPPVQHTHTTQHLLGAHALWATVSRAPRAPRSRSAFAIGMTLSFTPHALCSLQSSPVRSVLGVVHRRNTQHKVRHLLFLPKDKRQQTPCISQMTSQHSTAHSTALCYAAEMWLLLNGCCGSAAILSSRDVLHGALNLAHPPRVPPPVAFTRRPRLAIGSAPWADRSFELLTSDVDLANVRFSS